MAELTPVGKLPPNHHALIPSRIGRGMYDPSLPFQNAVRLGNLLRTIRLRWWQYRFSRCADADAGASAGNRQEPPLAAK